MKPEDLFTAEENTIELGGIDSLVKLTRFIPSKPDLFLDWLELAEDLRSDSSSILYTQGTLISRERISRLMQLRGSAPELQLTFKIKRTDRLIQKFREEIGGRLKQVFERRKGIEIFAGLMLAISGSLDQLVEETLAEENVTLAIYKMKFICESATSKRSLLFVDHAMEVAIFALALASSENFTAETAVSKDRLTELMKASLLYSYGALLQIDNILKKPAEERFDRYWEANRNGYFTLGRFQLSFEVMDTIRYLCEYHAGRKDFLTREELPATLAKIILVADAFLSGEGGLFNEPVPARQVVDNLNLKALEKECSDKAVQALTLGLNLGDIYEFYHAMQILLKQCPYACACPYPLTGFKSPTIFVCKKNVSVCPHLESSIKAVKLIHKLGELVPGEYSRCRLLTAKLLNFYEEHCEGIKNSIAGGKNPEQMPTGDEDEKDTPSGR